MESLDYSHNATLIAMSCLVALVAGFTGLSLTRGLAKKSLSQRKLSVALASIALGGGIWSMHFVAMLGLQLPILFYYDAAITLASALLAILIVGAALIVLHFMERTRTTILSAGAIIGIGVLVMHYVGMAGLELCRAVYTLPGVTLSSAVAVLLCMLAVWVAYQERNDRNIVLATFCFGLAVGSVHFLAMAGTAFVAEPQAGEFGPTMSNEVLAVGVLISSFVIFGSCLWVSTTYLTGVEAPNAASSDPKPETEAVQHPPAEPIAQFRVPCEKEGQKVFLVPQDIVFVRADGHYTQVYTEGDRLFCVWPINEARRRLTATGFLQTHRSYLVNPDKVARFEQSKDKGRCLFHDEDLPPVPVSRSKLKVVQETLLVSDGAFGAA